MTIEITNLTPFPNMRFSNLDAHGKEFGVFMVKGAWDIPEEGECTLSEEQEPFVFTDEYHGELNFSALRYPSDFVPYKPTTDIVLDATAYAPDGKPAKEWLVGVKVEDTEGYVVEKTLRILGPRYWVPKWKRKLSDEEKVNWREHRDLFEGWELSEPKPITKLPIRYEYAYGGMHVKGKKEDGTPDYEVYEYNLVGRGWIHPDLTDHTKPVPVPQIEDPNDPIIEPYKHYKPQSFGPVPPSWLPRRPLGGTYDQNWIDNIHPNWPPDYDFAYHNSASGELRAKKHLAGDLKIQLVGLHPAKRHWLITLPDVGVVAMVSGEQNVTNYRICMDSLYLEIDETAFSDLRAFTLWHLTFHILETSEIALICVPPNEQAGDGVPDDLKTDFMPVPLPESVAVSPHMIDPDYQENNEAK